MDIPHLVSGSRVFWCFNGGHILNPITLHYIISRPSSSCTSQNCPNYFKDKFVIGKKNELWFDKGDRKIDDNRDTYSKYSVRICKGLQLTFLWTPRPSRNGSTATAALYDSTSFMDEETRDPPASTTIILLTMLTKVFLLLLTSFSDLHLFSTLENGLLLPFCVSDREARNNTYLEVRSSAGRARVLV